MNKIKTIRIISLIFGWWLFVGSVVSILEDITNIYLMSAILTSLLGLFYLHWYKLDKVYIGAVLIFGYILLLISLAIVGF